MFSWLEAILDLAEKAVPKPVRDVIAWSLQGIGGILGTVTNDVAAAWHDLAVAMDAMRAGHDSLLSYLEGVFGQIIEHWIPKYAITAWWWVTHPMQLAQLLALYVVHWLEREAWVIAPYLGRFVLALIVRNVRRWLPVLEAILSAVL